MSNAAVIDGVLQHVSPSQIRDFLRCPRYWWAKRVLKLKEPESGSMAIGTDTHTILEHFYETGERPAFDPSFMAEELETPVLSAALALKLEEVPARSDSVLVETPRDYNTGLRPYGVLIKARADLMYEDGGSVTTCDWKTRGSRNFETPESLTTDPQSIVYQKYGFETNPTSTRSRFVHVYILTKSVGAVARKTDWATREEVDELYESLIVPVVAQMKEAASKTNPDDVPANTKSCFMYGRKCLYYDSCSAVTKHKPVVSADPFEGF